MEKDPVDVKSLITQDILSGFTEEIMMQKSNNPRHGILVVEHARTCICPKCESNILQKDEETCIKCSKKEGNSLCINCGDVVTSPHKYCKPCTVKLLTKPCVDCHQSKIIYQNGRCNSCFKKNNSLCIECKTRQKTKVSEYCFICFQRKKFRCSTCPKVDHLQLNGCCVSCNRSQKNSQPTKAVHGKK
jgi:hypothetical protein